MDNAKNNLILENDSYLMKTYERPPITFIKGDGVKLFDSNNKEYIDALSGIAVVSVGHSNKKVSDAIKEQSLKIQHVSNLFYNEPMLLLAKKLVEKTPQKDYKVFFSNSGAESNECAIKLARLWGSKRGKNEIIAANGSFHGRTLGALSATGQPDKWKGFKPLLDGFKFSDFNNLNSFKKNINEKTAAIMLEPIQGENGVIPAEEEFLKGIRELCSKKDILLILDEVQTGIGRTGSWFCFNNYNIEPDIFTLAKALGNGLPIAASLAKKEIADKFSPGHHGTTFGGGAIVAAASLATLDFIEEQNLISQIKEKETLFKDLLFEISEIEEIRGKGLMLGILLKEKKSKEITNKALELGLIVNSIRDNIIRITPPLIISKEEIIKVVEILKTAIKHVYKKIK